MNKTQNYFYRQKYNNNNYNTLQNAIKSNLLNRSIRNKKKINLNLFQKASQDGINRKTILSHSIETRNNKNLNLRNRTINKSINKSVQKRVKFRQYLTENKFSTTNNSIKNFKLDNSNSSFDSIITEEGNENLNDSNKKINIKKVIINDKNNKLLNKNGYNNKIMKTEKILTKKKRKIIFNGLTNNDNKIIKVNFDAKKTRNNTIEKRKSKKKELSLTPDFKNSRKNKKSDINHSINNRTIKTMKVFENKNTNNNITKSNEIRKSIKKISIKNKCELIELKDNIPIDINCIFLTTYNEIKLKIKKYFKKTRSIINEKENNIKILKNGFNIEINFYTIKHIEKNNVYICFKFKGGNKISNKEIINDLLIYLHNN